MHAGENRGKQEDHQQKRARAGFQDSPYNEPPIPAYQVMQHQQRQTTESDADPKQVRDEIGAEELLHHRGNLSSSCRSCAGRLCVLAFWLNCSARTYATMAQRSAGLIWAA